MILRNFEFKANVEDYTSMEQLLLTLNPKFIGTDQQKDTYFNVINGRLKLREGTIENSLIQYERENLQDSKKSDIILYKHKPDEALKEILSLQFGVKVVVEKIRKIYFIENVKFHFDEVPGLGQFIEVEAIDETGLISIESLQEQCNHYFDFFGLNKAWMVDKSYSDLLLEKRSI
jgi:predicted adenylyl cyclase CyaB